MNNGNPGRLGHEESTGVSIYRCSRCHRGHVLQLQDSFFREFCDECLEYLSEQLVFVQQVGPLQ